jgi:Fe-S-cluster containining protein
MRDETKKLLAIKRTTCDCESCRCGCYTNPGTLSPTDIVAIESLRCVDVGQREAWWIRHAEISAAARMRRTVEIKQADGSKTTQVVDIPVAVIVPSLVVDEGSPTGKRCVFLGEDGRCGIHEASPVGCRLFDSHQPTVVALRILRVIADESVHSAATVMLAPETATEADRAHELVAESLLKSKKISTSSPQARAQNMRELHRIITAAQLLGPSVASAVRAATACSGIDLDAAYIADDGGPHGV